LLFEIKQYIALTDITSIATSPRLFMALARHPQRMKPARRVPRHCERQRSNPVSAMDKGAPCASAVLDCFAFGSQ
jgi:hypothetical protein